MQAKEEVGAVLEPASLAAFSFDTPVSAGIDDPETPRLFPASVQCQPTLLGSGVLTWDIISFGRKVSQYALLSCFRQVCPTCNVISS